MPGIKAWEMAGMMDRIPMTEVDWFKRSGHLAIADVVYVRGVGLCSHQLPKQMRPGRHRVMDMSGTIYITDTTSLLEILPGDTATYWKNATWT